MSVDKWATLRKLLQRRLDVIGDWELRQRDPEKQMRQLQEISQAIDHFRHQQCSELPPRLRHFLAQASFSKALDFLDQMKR